MNNSVSKGTDKNQLDLRQRVNKFFNSFWVFWAVILVGLWLYPRVMGFVDNYGGALAKESLVQIYPPGGNIPAEYCLADHDHPGYDHPNGPDYDHMGWTHATWGCVYADRNPRVENDSEFQSQSGRYRGGTHTARFGRLFYPTDIRCSQGDNTKCLISIDGTNECSVERSESAKKLCAHTTQGRIALDLKRGDRVSVTYAGGRLSSETGASGLYVFQGDLANLRRVDEEEYVYTNFFDRFYRDAVFVRLRNYDGMMTEPTKFCTKHTIMCHTPPPIELKVMLDGEVYLDIVSNGKFKWRSHLSGAPHLTTDYGQQYWGWNGDRMVLMIEIIRV